MAAGPINPFKVLQKSFGTPNFAPFFVVALLGLSTPLERLNASKPDLTEISDASLRSCFKHWRPYKKPDPETNLLRFIDIGIFQRERGLEALRLLIAEAQLIDENGNQAPSEVIRGLMSFADEIREDLRDLRISRSRISLGVFPRGGNLNTEAIRLMLTHFVANQEYKDFGNLTKWQNKLGLAIKNTRKAVQKRRQSGENKPLQLDRLFLNSFYRGKGKLSDLHLIDKHFISSPRDPSAHPLFVDENFSIGDAGFDRAGMMRLGLGEGRIPFPIPDPGEIFEFDGFKNKTATELLFHDIMGHFKNVVEFRFGEPKLFFRRVEIYQTLEHLRNSSLYPSKTPNSDQETHLFSRLLELPGPIVDYFQFFIFWEFPDTSIANKKARLDQLKTGGQKALFQDAFRKSELRRILKALPERLLKAPPEGLVPATQLLSELGLPLSRDPMIPYLSLRLTNKGELDVILSPEYNSDLEEIFNIFKTLKGVM